MTRVLGVYHALWPACWVCNTRYDPRVGCVPRVMTRVLSVRYELWPACWVTLKTIEVVRVRGTQPYTILPHTALPCTALPYTALSYTGLLYTALPSPTLPCLPCPTLPCSPLLWSSPSIITCLFTYKCDVLPELQSTRYCLICDRGVEKMCHSLSSHQRFVTYSTHIHIWSPLT